MGEKKSARNGLNARPAAQRRRQRAFVEIIQFAADRHAVGEAGAFDAEMGKKVGDVMRRRLAVDRGVDGEDHLPDAAFRDAPDQFRNVEVVRPDAVERRQRASEHVVLGGKDPGALQRPEIADRLHHHDFFRIAARIGANGAGVAGVDIAAGRAGDDFFLGLPGTTGWSNTFQLVPVVLWNPLIQTGNGNFGVQNNQFGFDITGTPAIPIVVEASTNLANPVWTPLTNVTLTNGLFHFSEPAQPNTPARYYRIGSP